MSGYTLSINESMLLLRDYFGYFETQKVSNLN